MPETLDRSEQKPPSWPFVLSAVVMFAILGYLVTGDILIGVVAFGAVGGSAGYVLWQLYCKWLIDNTERFF